MHRCDYVVCIILSDLPTMLWTHRTDTTTSSIIDTGARIAESNGLAFAWAYLAGHGISESSIARILSNRRRRPLLTLMDNNNSNNTGTTGPSAE